MLPQESQTILIWPNYFLGGSFLPSFPLASCSATPVSEQMKASHMVSLSSTVSSGHTFRNQTVQVHRFRLKLQNHFYRKIVHIPFFQGKWPCVAGFSIFHSWLLSEFYLFIYLSINFFSLQQLKSYL